MTIVMRITTKTYHGTIIGLWTSIPPVQCTYLSLTWNHLGLVSRTNENIPVLHLEFCKSVPIPDALPSTDWFSKSQKGSSWVCDNDTMPAGCMHTDWLYTVLSTVHSSRVWQCYICNVPFLSPFWCQLVTLGLVCSESTKQKSNQPNNANNKKPSAIESLQLQYTGCVTNLYIARIFNTAFWFRVQSRCTRLHNIYPLICPICFKFEVYLITSRMQNRAQTANVSCRGPWWNAMIATNYAQ